MGRKSSSKKQKHLDEQAAKEAAALKKSMRIWTREKWLATGLVLIGLVLFILVGLASWSYLMRAKSISLFVPRDTIALAEINTDFTDPQWTWFDQMANGMADEVADEMSDVTLATFPKLPDLITTLNDTLQIDFTKDIYPWLSRRAGAALLPGLKPVLFLEVKDKKQALDYLRSRHLQDGAEHFTEVAYRGFTMYEYAESSPFTIVSIGRYIVVSSDEETAKKIIDASKDKQGSLYGEYTFQRIKSAFSGDRLAFIYGKPAYLDALTTSNTPVFSADTNASQPSRQSLLQLISSAFSNTLGGEGVSIKMVKSMLVVEHEALLSEATRAAKSFLKVPEKYRATLAEFFTPEVRLFAGGIDLPAVLSQFSSLVATKIRSSQTTESQLGTVIIELLGNKLSIDDLTNLTKHEYAIGLEPEIAANVPPSSAYPSSLKFVVRFGPETSDQQRQVLLKKAATALQSLDPRLLNSPAQNSPAQNLRSNLSYPTTLLGDVGVITATQQLMAQTVAAYTGGNKNSLRMSALYAQMIAPQMQSADDILYLQPSKIQLPVSLSWLRAVSQLSMASTAFEDGMKTTVLIAPMLKTAEERPVSVPAPSADLAPSETSTPSAAPVPLALPSSPSAPPKK